MDAPFRAPERVLFVHAHPGDEALLTGGTIATLVDRGAHVTVLTCTRGERVEVVDPELAPLRGSAALVERREAELAESLRILGVTDHRRLGEVDARWAGREPRRYEDSGMRGFPPSNDPAVPMAGSLAHAPGSHADAPAGSLAAAEPGEVAADVAAVIAAVGPDVVVAAAGDPADHPDRIRAHHAARTAADVLGVAFYAVQHPYDPAAVVPDEGPSGESRVHVDVRPVLDRKRAALAAHRSHVVVDGDLVAVGDRPAQRIPEVERFVRLREHPVQPLEQTSWFGRIGSCAIALVLGAFAGGILTLVHQSRADVGGVAVPWGILVAVLVSAALLVGLRLVFSSRLVAAFAAAGLIGVAAVLSIQSADGSTIVPGDPIGYVWVFAPVVLSILVLGWPFGVRPRAGASRSHG